MSLYVDIRKSLRDFELNIRFQSNGGILALLGASGCGKSMTLKCIAGIEKPDEGVIALDGVTLFDSERKINLPPQKRKTGYLFQSAALFPNMTAAQNVLCGLHRIKSASEKRRRLSELVSMFRLEGLENRYPHELSGGQQQRAALARTLASEPELIMLDEPFSALDSHLKWQLEQELCAVLKKLKKKAIYVSHDRHEVYRLCDKIAIVSGGSIDSMGSRELIFGSPRTYASCILTGCKNISRAEINPEGSIAALNWGMSLYSAKPSGKNAAFVGIDAKKIKACGTPDSLNSFEYEVIEKIDDISGVILLIKNKNASSSGTIRWEMGREKFEKLDLSRPFAFIPPESVMLLSE